MVTGRERSARKAWVFSMMRRAPLARPQVPAPTKSMVPSPPRRTLRQPARRVSARQVVVVVAEWARR